MHHFYDLGPLVVDQLKQLRAHARLAVGRDVVFAACRQSKQRGCLVVIRIGFFGEGFAHRLILARPRGS